MALCCIFYINGSCNDPVGDEYHTASCFIQPGYKVNHTNKTPYEERKKKRKSFEQCLIGRENRREKAGQQ